MDLKDMSQTPRQKGQQVSEVLGALLDPANGYGDKIELDSTAILDIKKCLDGMLELIGGEDHILNVRRTGWAIQHPIECRPDLTECAYHKAAMVHPGKDQCYASLTGDYRMTFSERGDGRFDLVTVD